MFSSSRKKYEIGGKLGTGLIFSIDRRKTVIWSQLSVHFKLEQNFLLLKGDQLSWFAWDGEVS